MPKVRTTAYRGGDSFTVKIPSDIDPKSLKWINSHKWISPAIINLIEKEANSQNVSNNNKE